MGFLCQGVTQELEILYARTAAGDVRKTNYLPVIVYTKQQLTTHTIGKGRNALKPAFTTLLKSTVERFLEIADDKMRRL